MLETRLKTAGIDHTVLHVKDLARSKKFYMEVLGMTVNHEDAIHSFLWCGNGQMVPLFQVPEGTHRSAQRHEPYGSPLGIWDLRRGEGIPGTQRVHRDGPTRRRPLHLLRLPRRPSFAAFVPWGE